MSNPDVVIVGAGFGGLYMLHYLRERGFNARVVEAADDVGGTWYWNRYPGARCDVPSIEYSYSFSRHIEDTWRWTERYAAQPEILRYLQYVAQELDLRRDISFSTRVTDATWDETTSRWKIHTDRELLTARFLILGTGNLSVPRMPDWPGMDAFKGKVLHTAQWPDDVDLSGQHIAVVGTGSSGVQVIPPLARSARSVTVFQRTPSYMVPASNRPLTDEELRQMQPRLPELRAAAKTSPFGFFQQVLGQGAAKSATDHERERVLEQSWGAGTAGLLLSYVDILFDPDSNRLVADFAARKIAQLVHDPEAARKLIPSGFPVGARRLVSEIGFFETMNQPHVKLVDTRDEPIVRVTANQIETARHTYPIDTLVCATGFQAITGSAAAIHIVGRGGQTLREEWSGCPRSYLGLGVSGFPNLFTITGLGSPGVLSNVVVSIEQHVEWIGDCLAHLRAEHADVIEVRAEDEARWMRHVDEVAHHSLFPQAPNSWYHGTTAEGQKLFLPYVGGVGAYRKICEEVVADGYRGFRISRAADKARDAQRG